jgi:putative modified peptide
VSEGTPIDLRMQITREQAEEFLDRIVNDPDFRSYVEKDPVTALREYDVEISPDAVPHLAQLPAPEDIDRLRANLAAGDEYSDVGAVRGMAWFIALSWFVSVPKPGDDAPG